MRLPKMSQRAVGGIILLLAGTAAFAQTTTTSAATATTEIDFFGGDGGSGTPYYAYEYLAIPTFNGPGTLTGVSLNFTTTIGTDSGDPSSILDGTPSSFYVTGVSSPTSFGYGFSLQAYILDAGGALVPDVPTSSDTNPCTSAITTAGVEASSPCLLASMVGTALNSSIITSFGTPYATSGLAYDNVWTGISTAGTLANLNGISQSASGSDSNFSGFTGGSGFYYLPVYMEFQEADADNGPATYVQNVFAGVTAQVTYSYETPTTPEPASFVLMLGALGAAPWIIRKRRTSAPDRESV